MAIRTYIENGKKYYEVYVNGFDSRGNRIQRKRGGFETQKKAESVEFELKRELAMRREEKVPYRWHEWVTICLNRMKMNMQPSTVINYRGSLAKWINPIWKDLELTQITREKVYSAIYESLDPNFKPYTRKCICRNCVRGRPRS